MKCLYFVHNWDNLIKQDTHVCLYCVSTYNLNYRIQVLPQGGCFWADGDVHLNVVEFS